jgi:triacylglycerol lipase
MKMNSRLFSCVIFVVVAFICGCSSSGGGASDQENDSAFVPDDDSMQGDDSGDDSVAGGDDSGPVFTDDTSDDSADDDAQPGTKYPIVLCHGFMGWGYMENFANFYKVADTLTENGFDVYEPWVSSINSMEERAAELAVKIEARYPGQRINLLCHSQGGLDARYMISTMGWGDRVATLTTLSTPHKGTSIADIVEGLVPGVAQWMIDAILNVIGMDWDGISELTHDYVENVFNPANPDDPNVQYFSFHGDGTEIFLPLEVTHFIMEMYEGCNDGVIGCDSATYAQDLGPLPVDHFGICGQPFGAIDWDWLGFYLEYAKSLKEQGY